MITDLDSQKTETVGSLAALAGHPEGIVINVQGSEHTPAFSKTQAQKNLYQSALKVMQGTPYSVDPTGKTIYTDWFVNDQGKPTKITILVSENNIHTNVFTKVNGQIGQDKKQAARLESQIKDNNV